MKCNWPIQQGWEICGKPVSEPTHFAGEATEVWYCPEHVNEWVEINEGAEYV